MMAEGKNVDFQCDGRNASAYLVEASGQQRPGLIVVHEWWGLNDHIKDIARRFADAGYTVLAPDLYDGKVTKDAEEAGKLMQGLKQEQALQTLDAAVDYLNALPTVVAGHIGVTGFCMGGTYALLLACHNSQIKAAAPFYGDVPPDETLERLSAPVLFIGADSDPWITMEKMDRLRSALQKFAKQGEVKIYEGVGHAFFNDTRPEAYDREAAQSAWQRVLDFLSKSL